VGMCRVACEHDASRPVALSYSLVDAKPGSQITSITLTS
jgi:hypothetical protein